MNAYEVIQRLEEVSGKLDKESIIREAYEADCTQFFEGAKLAYSKLVTFGTKKIPETATDGYDDVHPDFDDLLSDLQNRSVTKMSGHRAAEAIQKMADECSPDLWNSWYRRILIKDFRCGTTATIINGVLKKYKTAKATALMVPTFSPQLAHPAKKHMSKVKGKKFLDPKLDGVRFLAFFDVEAETVNFYSRNGIVNNNFPQLEEMLKTMIGNSIHENTMMDGEIVSRNFQELMTQWNRKSNVDTSDSIFAVFDMIPTEDFNAGICHIPQDERHEALLELSDAFLASCGESVYVVPKIVVDLDTEEGQATFKRFNRETVEAGFEGIMLKDIKAPYHCKRSVGWLKIKPFITVDLRVIAVNAGEEGKEFANTMGSLTFEGVDDESGKFINVNVSGGFSHALRDDIWADQDAVIGAMAEIESDAITQNKDSVDVFSLRFPQFKTWRPDKD